MMHPDDIDLFDPIDPSDQWDTDRERPIDNFDWTIAYPCPPCSVCGERAEIEVLPDALARWQAGEYVQTAFPEMTADDREMLISGTHPACWDQMWGDDE